MAGFFLVVFVVGYWSVTISLPCPRSRPAIRQWCRPVDGIARLSGSV